MSELKHPFNESDDILDLSEFIAIGSANPMNINKRLKDLEEKVERINQAIEEIAGALGSLEGRAIFFKEDIDFLKNKMKILR